MYIYTQTAHSTSLFFFLVQSQTFLISFKLFTLNYVNEIHTEVHKHDVHKYFLY